MEEEPKKKEELSLDYPLYNDVLEIIINELSPTDWLQFSSVSRWCLVNIENKFHALAKEILGKKAEHLKENDNWRKLFFLSFTPEYVLLMREWRTEQLIKAIEDKNFSILKKILIENLEKQLLRYSSDLVIETNIDVASFLLAYGCVNIDAAFDAARIKARDATWEALGVVDFDAAHIVAHDANWESVHIAALDSDWKKAGDAVKVARKSAKEAFIWNGDNGNVFNDARANVQHAIGYNISLTLKKYIDKASNEIGLCAWELSYLYVLAYIANNTFIKNFFISAYEAARVKFASDKSFNLSADEIINFYAMGPYLNEDLSDNLFLISLKRMAETLAIKVKPLVPASIEDISVVTIQPSKKPAFKRAYKCIGLVLSRTGIL